MINYCVVDFFIIVLKSSLVRFYSSSYDSIQGFSLTWFICICNLYYIAYHLITLSLCD